MLDYYNHNYGQTDECKSISSYLTPRVPTTTRSFYGVGDSYWSRDSVHLLFKLARKCKMWQIRQNSGVTILFGEPLQDGMSHSSRSTTGIVVILLGRPLSRHFTPQLKYFLNIVSAREMVTWSDGSFGTGGSAQIIWPTKIDNDHCASGRRMEILTLFEKNSSQTLN